MKVNGKHSGPQNPRKGTPTTAVVVAVPVMAVLVEVVVIVVGVKEG